MLFLYYGGPKTCDSQLFVYHFLETCCFERLTGPEEYFRHFHTTLALLKFSVLPHESFFGHAEISLKSKRQIHHGHGYWETRGPRRLGPFSACLSSQQFRTLAASLSIMVKECRFDQNFETCPGYNVIYS